MILDSPGSPHECGQERGEEVEHHKVLGVGCPWITKRPLHNHHWQSTSTSASSSPHNNRVGVPHQEHFVCRFREDNLCPAGLLSVIMPNSDSLNRLHQF
jgi:hypothetical protein